ncbi:hypothetical protein D3C74_486960 [compost metagenome]
MDVRILGGTHHPGRIHFDRLQVDRADFHAALFCRLADGVFSRIRGRYAQGNDGQRQGFLDHVHNP